MFWKRLMFWKKQKIVAQPTEKKAEPTETKAEHTETKAEPPKE